MNYFSLSAGAALLATLFACGAGAPDQSGAPAGAAGRTQRNEQTAARPAEAAPPQDGARRITVAELSRLVEQDGAVVVDVRGSVEFEMGRIKGARSIPLGLIAGRAAELPKDKLIVTYCT
ncbi:MAG TPA: rhodanese-like domain-containing protein [Pyrinomonadaceae bacterium]|jgi:3-mercaptopyruvate sulfurtransferase SseA